MLSVRARHRRRRPEGHAPCTDICPASDAVARGAQPASKRDTTSTCGVCGKASTTVDRHVAVAGAGQQARVASEGAGVAAHEHQAGRPGGAHRPHATTGEAGPRRVGHHHVAAAGPATGPRRCARHGRRGRAGSRERRPPRTPRPPPARRAARDRRWPANSPTPPYRSARWVPCTSPTAAATVATSASAASGPAWKNDRAETRRRTPATSSCNQARLPAAQLGPGHDADAVGHDDSPPRSPGRRRPRPSARRCGRPTRTVTSAPGGNRPSARTSATSGCATRHPGTATRSWLWWRRSAKRPSGSATARIVVR